MNKDTILKIVGVGCGILIAVLGLYFMLSA